MGHAHHFLSRLDRLESAHLGLALTLYRDHTFTRELLQRLRLPEHVARVALSLDHPVEGPFVVLQRSGAFITCLGRGMTLTPDVVVIPRSRLDAGFAEASEFEGRAALARRFADAAGSLGLLMDRLFVAGDEFDRDEFSVLGAVAPAMRVELLSYQFKSVGALNDLRGPVASIKRVRPPHHRYLRIYWQTLWAVAHLQLLVGLDGPAAMFDSMRAETRAEYEGPSLTWGLVRQNVAPLAVRAAWFVGRYGTALLDPYASAFRRARSYFEATNTGLGLIALGSRFPEAAADVRAALAHQSLFGHALTRAVKEALSASFELWCESEDRRDAFVDEALIAPAQEHFQARTRGLRAAPGYRFDDARDVPADLALATLLQHPAEVTKSTESIVRTALLAAHVQSLPAEAFFLTAGASRALRRAVPPETSVEIARYVDEVAAAPTPTRAAERPGRNEPCSCGSGKKYKRCCADAPAA